MPVEKPAEEPSEAASSETVLVVEDDVSTQQVMELMLQKEHDVSVADDMDGALH